MFTSSEVTQQSPTPGSRAYGPRRPRRSTLQFLPQRRAWHSGLSGWTAQHRQTRSSFPPTAGLLDQGQHVLRYKLRAETPGQFHALPAKGFAMYAPEVKAISDEMRLRIKDKE
jgi:uncharacterized protein YfaS (alpha-2-macroglobulin family)